MDNIEQDIRDDLILIPAISSLSLNGDLRDYIFLPPSLIGNRTIWYTLDIPENTELKFEIGTVPSTWTKSGNGVDFSIKVEYADNLKTIFRKYMGPQKHTEERKWNGCKLNLGKYGTKQVKIFFITTLGPKNSHRFNWTFWGRPQLQEKDG